MPDREKLIELLWEYDQMRMMRMSIEECADKLVPKGLTVQEGKPLEAFLHPIDAYKGLKAKYLVFKADTGAKVDNCFILRPDKDSAAVEALRAYARNAENETLAQDIYDWVGKGVTIQQWIPVTERLPQDNLPVGALCEVVQVLLNDGSVTIGWCNRGLQCWFHMPIQETRMVGHDYEKTPVVAWQPLAKRN